jgi:hypothetical protein
LEPLLGSSLVALVKISVAASEGIALPLTSENFQNQLSTKTSGFLVKVADKLRMCGSTLLWLIGIIALGLFISAVASFVEAEKVKDWKLNEWIETYFKDLGHQIETKAGQLLADSIGNNLEVIKDGVEIPLESYTYLYDYKHNWIQRTMNFEGKVLNITIRNIKYYED